MAGLARLPFGGARGDVESAARRVFAPHLQRSEDLRFWEAWRGTLRLLRPLGRVSQGNRIEVFCDGDPAFEAMWEAIAVAEVSVAMNTYTLEPDGVGRRTLAELTRAAKRGCEVSLVYDAIGSHRLEEEDVADLKAAGGSVLPYNPVFRWGSRLSRLVRNHRKILVVDDRIGFCGGMNVADEYAGERHGNSMFRDTHLRLSGPCVPDLAQLMRDLVAEMTRKRGRWTPSLGSAQKRSTPQADGSLVQILESHVRRERRAIQKALRFTVARAVRTCFLTTPYFVPPGRLLRVLKRAAKQGVDVRVLTAGRSDVPMVHYASQHLYGRLLRAGVRIFEMQDRMLHAKTVVIDDVYATVGSFNLDSWSYRRNLEVNVSVLDRGMAETIQGQFEGDLEQSKEVTLETWGARSLRQRIGHWAAYQLMRI